MNFVVAGYNLQWGSLLVDPALPVDNASATINSVAVAYVRALDVRGHGGKVTVTVPLSTSEFRGEYLGQFAESKRQGIADPRVTFVVNIAGGPALDRQRFGQWRQRTLLGVSMHIGIPIGQYDSSKVVNLGTNRWGFRPGIGVSHQTGAWIVEGAASVAFFTANNEFVGTHRFEQRPMGVFEASAIRYLTPRVWGAAHVVWVAGAPRSSTASRAPKLGSTPDWARASPFRSRADSLSKSALPRARLRASATTSPVSPSCISADGEVDPLPRFLVRTRPRSCRRVDRSAATILT
jgi:hypothetical protein